MFGDSSQNCLTELVHRHGKHAAALAGIIGVMTYPEAGREGDTKGSMKGRMVSLGKTVGS